MDQSGKMKGIKVELKAQVDEHEKGYPSLLVSCPINITNIS